jgi:hypothetical protein
VRVSLSALVLVVVLAGCGGGKSAHSTSTTTSTKAISISVSTTTTAATATTVVTHGRFHYPPALVTSYMRSCVGAAGAAGKKRDYCACTLDRLSDNVSTRDFQEIGLQHGRIPPRMKRSMVRAVKACASKL